jgi:NAD(P)-dependent dehydrogenase (short-subunit alcohol dehydrogenase family)
LRGGCRGADLRRHGSRSGRGRLRPDLEAFGRIDGCFANAGVGTTGRQAFVDRAEDEWRRMFATNLDKPRCAT